MHGRHCKKAPRFLVFRGILVFVLALVLSVSPFATVMANTVSAVVVDGDNMYTFNMINADLGTILAQAEERGLEPLGPLDVAEPVENTTTVIIRRGLSLSVVIAGRRRNLMAYRGDTVRKTLEDNNIILKSEDRVVPDKDQPVEAGITIEVFRACQVTVAADGSWKKISMVGGTVADALKEAGVSLGELDAANYGLGEYLFDGMTIRVSRTVRMKVTADGRTTEQKVTADTVKAAVRNMGITLSEHDRLSVDPGAKPEDGMVVVVTRVTVKEEKETEEIPFTTQYVTSDSMYEDEEEVRTPGEPGEKEITYKVTLVEGKQESKEVVSEETVREPVTEVIVRGTRERETPAANLVPVDGDDYFIDHEGNTVYYRNKYIDSCTAYTSDNGVTSTGMPAQYGVVAVNPNIIPYGTRMYIVSPDGGIVYGYCVAGDTGGALIANEVLIDLYYDTEEACVQFGRRNMIIYIL